MYFKESLLLLARKLSVCICMCPKSITVTNIHFQHSRKRTQHMQWNLLWAALASSDNMPFTTLCLSNVVLKAYGKKTCFEQHLPFMTLVFENVKVLLKTDLTAYVQGLWHYEEKWKKDEINILCRWENTGKSMLRYLAALTNSIYCNFQHGALMNRFPVMMTPIGWREFLTIFWSV